MTTVRTALGLLACLALAPAPAAAQDADSPGWQNDSFRLAYKGSAVKRDERGVFRPAESVFSAPTADRAGVAFTCYNGKLTALVLMESMDVRQTLRDGVRARRAKNARPTFTFDGEAEPSEPWLQLHSLDVLRAGRFKATADLYNAVLRGSAVSMEWRGTDYPITLPPVDDTFRNFGGECGVGRHRKR